MKILLCILSDQHIPNLLSVHHHKPDYLILLESDFMRKKKKAQYFIKTLNIPGTLRYDVGRNCFIEPIENVSRVEPVKRVLKAIYEKNAEDDWIVNISGGTKIMAIAAYDFFRHTSARIEYIDEQNSNLFLKLGSDEVTRSAHKMTVQEFIAGYGFEINHRDITSIRQKKHRLMRLYPCARLIAESACGNTILNLNENTKQKIQGLLEVEKTMFCDVPDKTRWVVEKTFFRKIGSLPKKYIDNNAVAFLTGGWLETFLWGLLYRNRETLGILDVLQGIHIHPHGRETHNELDIVFVRDDYGLYMIECKSGKNASARTKDILFKLEAIAGHVRALRIRSILCIMSPDIFGKDGKIKEGVRDRAASYRISLLTYKDINRLARNPDDTSLVRSLFFR